MAAERRDAVRAALAEHLPELSQSDVHALEVGIWNWTLEEAGRRGNQRMFDATMSDDYCRRAVHCVSNLSSSASGNGNDWLLPLVLAGSVEPYDVPFMDAHSLNRPLLAKYHDKKADKDFTDRESYVAITTVFECPSCSEKKTTYRQVQMRGGDEGSTLFLHCLCCGHQWRDTD